MYNERILFFHIRNFHGSSTLKCLKVLTKDFVAANYKVYKKISRIFFSFKFIISDLGILMPSFHSQHNYLKYCKLVEALHTIHACLSKVYSKSCSSKNWSRTQLLSQNHADYYLLWQKELKISKCFRQYDCNILEKIRLNRNYA